MGTYPGATPRDLNEKLGEHPSVLDFGADRTGATDSTPAFQAAIDSLASVTATKTLFIPSGTYRLDDTVQINDPITMYGDGETSILQRGATLGAATKGLLDVLSSDVELRNFTIDGQKLQPTKIAWGSVSNPIDPVLTQDTSIWVHGPATDIRLIGITVRYTGGYSAIFDATSGDIKDVKLERVHLRDCRSITQGGNPGDQNYGSWACGVLFQGDGNTGACENVSVAHCSAKRCAGTGFWSHLYAFNKLHKAFRYHDCNIEDNGFHGILIGGVVGATVTGCTFRRIGYVSVDGASAPAPAWDAAGDYAIGLDTSGLAYDVTYSNNTFLSCNGGCIGGDNLGFATITGCTMRLPVVGELEYGEDQIALFGPGQNGSLDACYGYEGNHAQWAVPTAQYGGYHVTISQNNFKGGFRKGAILMFAARENLVEGNKITHDDATTNPPIHIAHFNADPQGRSTSNVIANNTIRWAQNAAAIQETTSLGVPWQATDINWVSLNFVFGGCYEFAKDDNSGSVTSVLFSAPVPTSAPFNNGIVQSVDLAGATQVLRWRSRIDSELLGEFIDYDDADPALADTLLNVSRPSVSLPNKYSGMITTGPRTDRVAVSDSVATGHLFSDRFSGMKAFEQFPADPGWSEPPLVSFPNWWLTRYSEARGVLEYSTGAHPDPGVATRWWRAQSNFIPQQESGVSAGLLEGGTFTDTATQVIVAAGFGAFRKTNNSSADLVEAWWPETPIDIASGEDAVIGVELVNAAGHEAQVVKRTGNVGTAFNGRTEFALGVADRLLGNPLESLFGPQWADDVLYRIQKRFVDEGAYILSGGFLDTSGTPTPNQMSVSAGEVYLNVTRSSFSGLAEGANFIEIWPNGSGDGSLPSHWDTATVSSWNNSEYASGGGKSSLQNNRWNWHDVYHYSGQTFAFLGNQNSTQEDAAAGSDGYPLLPFNGIYLGRIVFQQGAADSSQIIRPGVGGSAGGGGGGGASPTGPQWSLQYHDGAGALVGDANLIWDQAQKLRISGAGPAEVGLELLNSYLLADGRILSTYDSVAGGAPAIEATAGEIQGHYLTAEHWLTLVAKPLPGAPSAGQARMAYDSADSKLKFFTEDTGVWQTVTGPPFASGTYMAQMSVSGNHQYFFNADAGYFSMVFVRSRGTFGSPTPTVAGDLAADLSFSAYGTGGYQEIGHIFAKVDAVAGADMAGSLDFWIAAADGTNFLQARVTKDGLIAQNNFYVGGTAVIGSAYPRLWWGEYDQAISDQLWSMEVQGLTWKFQTRTGTATFGTPTIMEVPRSSGNPTLINFMEGGLVVNADKTVQSDVGFNALGDVANAIQARNSAASGVWGSKITADQALYVGNHLASAYPAAPNPPGDYGAIHQSQENGNIYRFWTGAAWQDLDVTALGSAPPFPSGTVLVENEGASGVAILRVWSSSAPNNSPNYQFQRARGTEAVPENVVDGDTLGEFIFSGRESGSFVAKAFLTARWLAGNKSEFDWFMNWNGEYRTRMLLRPDSATANAAQLFLQGAGYNLDLQGSGMMNEIFLDTRGSALLSPPSGYGGIGHVGGSSYRWWNATTSTWFTLDMANLSGGGGTSPGGPTDAVQYNNSGSFAGTADFAWDDPSKILYLKSNGGLVVEGISASVNVSQSTASNALQAPLGGVLAKWGTLSDSIRLANTTPANPGGGYGGIAYAGAALYQWYNGTSWFTLDMSNLGGGGSAVPGGNDKAVQYNGSGSFAGTGNLEWDNAAQNLSVIGVNGQAALTVQEGFVDSNDGFRTDSAEFDAIQTNSVLGGAHVGLLTTRLTSDAPIRIAAGSAVNQTNTNYAYIWFDSSTRQLRIKYYASGVWNDKAFYLL